MMSATAGIDAGAALVSPDTGTDEVNPRVAADPKWVAINSQLNAAKTQLQSIENQLQQARALTQGHPPNWRPPQKLQKPGTFGPWNQVDNPEYAPYMTALALINKYEDPQGLDDSGKKELETLRKRVSDLTVNLGTQASTVMKTSPAGPTPDIRTVNGIPMERQPDGSYAPVRVSGADGVTPASGTTTGSKAGKTTKSEKGPDGKTYLVTYNVDAAGNESWNGEKPVPLDLGTDPNAAVTLQTAQVNLQRAQQQLAQENDPLKRAQLQAQVEQAQFTLEQARAKAPLDLQQQQLNIQQAEQNLNRPSVQTVGGRAVGINPNTGQAVFNTDLMSPEDRARTEETAQLQLETARRGQLPANALAAYSQETTRLQETARQELARLQELQKSGAISAAEASQQFNNFFQTRVETPLAGLRAAAEEAQRAEREQNAQRQREEDRWVFQQNQAREQAGIAAGNTARQQAIAIAPQVRTPQFLQQYGQAVANMSQRAGAPNAEAALAMPAGQRITADTFNPANFKGAIPDIETYAQQASQRALSSISPAVAARVGGGMPQLPGLPDLSQLLNQLPYQGPLTAAPRNALPVPGQEALDLGTGMARTMYPGGGYLDWSIPAG
jgi:hypothetical protein